MFLLRTLLTAATLGAAVLTAGCGGTDSATEAGEPIPGTGITSCGEDLADHAPPTGYFEGTLTVGEAETTFQASVLWQASCPGKETDTAAATEYVMTTLRVLEDDAGSPGAPIGETEISLEAVVTCEGAAPGVSDRAEVPTTTVQSLAAQCAEHLAAPPTGSPLHVQVELEGVATTCSAEEFTIVFRRQIQVDCPDP